ncbi:MAG TPA: hypothetical protein VMW27_07240 [Thermoanaerobaculia bacterium]|nr:hypothetical protein [Thermoanaerobaculia bacterium]
MRQGLGFTLLLLLTAAPAAAWDIRDDAPADGFRVFHERFSDAVYHYPRHGAAPLGLVGFEVYADAAVDQTFDDEGLEGPVIDDELTGGLLAVARVGARKGLPAGIDIGLAYGKVLDSDLDLVSADLQWAILKGGALSPALSLRLTGTQTLDSGSYDLQQYGAEVLLSKGFAVLTPYIGGGFVYSESRLSSPTRTLKEDSTRGVLYAGATLNLLLPKITVEVEKGEELLYSAKVAFGL